MKKVRILGSGCNSCRVTAERIGVVAKRLGIEVETDKVEDMVEIAAYGVIGTPAVVVDGVVVHAGSVPSEEQISSWISAGETANEEQHRGKTGFQRSGFVLGAVGVVIVAALFIRASRDTADEVPRNESELTAQVQPVQVAPTFVELGSDRCTSCRAMIPVLEELRGSECNVNVRFVDVWDDPAEGEEFGVTTIPTQVLLAPDGREIARHSGFWSADAIRAAFAENGYSLNGDNGSCGS